MTDTPPPPAAPAAPVPPAAPGPKQALSLTSFITGLASVVFFWIPGLGFLAALAGVILGFIGKAKEPAAPKWMWLIGIIAGFVGLLLNIIFVVVTIILPLAFLSSVGGYPY